MEAKYKFAMVDGRKEQVCGANICSPGSAGKSVAQTQGCAAVSWARLKMVEGLSHATAVGSMCAALSYRLTTAGSL